jgi:hypothetical protein
MQCLPLGGQPVAVAKVQAAKPLQGHPVKAIGKMVLVARIGGIEPQPKCAA